MRTLFIVLLLGNLVLLGWILTQTGAFKEFVSPAGESSVELASAAELAEDDGAAEKSVSESLATDESSIDADENPDVPGMVAPPRPARVCEVLGPFIDAGLGAGLLKELGAAGVQGETFETDVPAPSDYWVYFPPLQTRRAAMRQLAEFQNRGIDSFVITQGSLVNGVSLGLFTKKVSADELVKRMEVLGYPARIQEVYRSRKEFWIRTEYAGDRDDKTDLWRNIESRFPLMKRREEACK